MGRRSRAGRRAPWGERVFELAARIVKGLACGKAWPDDEDESRLRALAGGRCSRRVCALPGFPGGRATGRCRIDASSEGVSAGGRLLSRRRRAGGIRLSSAHLSSETRTIYYAPAAKSRQGGAFLATAGPRRPHHRVGCGGFVVGAGFAVGFGSGGAGFFTAGLGSSKVSVK